jgi:hypothetical protein
MTAAFGVLYCAEHCFLAVSKTNLVNAYNQVNVYVQLVEESSSELECLVRIQTYGRPHRQERSGEVVTANDPQDNQEVVLAEFSKRECGCS